VRVEQVSDAERVHIRDTLGALWTNPTTDPASGLHINIDQLVHDLLVLKVAEREIQRATVHTVARLHQLGAFAERGQRADTALADLWNIERAEARLVVTAAEQALPRVDLHGQPLPARLPATAEAFQAGAVDLRHLTVIHRLLASQAASHLTPDLQAAEQQIAGLATMFTPSELRHLGAQLLDRLDQDGAEPDHREPEPVNELFLTPDRVHGGGRLKGRFDQAHYDLIATVLDTKAAPLTSHDHRPLEQRQAEAMAEAFGWVADHADRDLLPEAGGNRPHINIHIRLQDLQNRARAACLDYGGTLTPAQLRWLCCDACIIPVVLDGAGQPLDVGRLRRTIPDGLRRAVAARDRGCAHPGCDRPISWCEIHYVVAWEQGGEPKLSKAALLRQRLHRC
jgi:Domain of unknown function (DUF222)